MSLHPFEGKKVLVVGLGMSGQAAAHFLLQQGAIVHGVDRQAAVLRETPEWIDLIKQGLILEGEHLYHPISSFDCLVVSPGVPSIHPLYQQAKQAGIEILGEMELGCRFVKNRMIGITGTNGKTTVTLLVAHVLNQCGKPARAIGNVGKPLTRELLTADPDEIFVVEMSSYQLETLYQPVLDVGVILNITPDHLDRYEGMEEYAKAKFLMERVLKPGRDLYLEERAFKEYGYLLNNQHVKTYGSSSDSWAFTRQGRFFIEGKETLSWPEKYQDQVSHEVENLMAAYLLCRSCGVGSEEFKSALSSFTKPAHRIQFVKQIKGVSYYDDSKGTNIDAVMRAVQSLKGTIVLIAGGMDKGAAYTPWLQAFANQVKCICAIGQAADKIQQQLSPHIPVHTFRTLDLAVRYAAVLAKEGDCVLLSPGCSSLDMFKDYAHRGEEFQRIVQQL